MQVNCIFENVFVGLLEDKFVQSRVPLGCYISLQYHNNIKKMFIESMLNAYDVECKWRIREKYR